MKVAPSGVPEKHPKLEMAAMEIKEILEKHDIAGMVFLFTPGFVKYTLNLAPSFSCVDINDKVQLKINPPILDPQNDAAYKQKLVDTVNMLGNFRIYGGKLTMALTQSEITVRKYFNMDQPPGPSNLSIQNGKS